MAAWVSDTLLNFYLVKNSKIANNSATNKAREKNKRRYKILRILECFSCMFDQIKGGQILL